MLARERWQTFENSWKKNKISNEHPVIEVTLSLNTIYLADMRLGQGVVMSVLRKEVLLKQDSRLV